MCRSSSSLLHDPGLFSFSIYFFQLFCSTSCKSNDPPSNLDWSNPVSSRKHNLMKSNKQKENERERERQTLTKQMYFEWKKASENQLGKQEHRETKTKREKSQNKEKEKILCKIAIKSSTTINGHIQQQQQPKMESTKSRIANSIPTRLIRERGKKSWWE